MMGSMIRGIQREWACDDKEDRDKQDCEEEIRDRDNCSRCEEFPHGVKVAHLIGKDADRCRTVRHFERQDMLEDIRRQYDIDLLAGHVDDAAPHRAHDEVESDGDAHADRQRDERRKGTVRDDAVIHAHRKERTGEGNDVDDEGCDRNVRIIRPRTVRDN